MNRPIIIGMLTAVVIGGRCFAQGNDASGSPNFTSKVRSLVAGNQEATSMHFRLRGTLSQAAVTANQTSVSTNFRILGGGISAIDSEFQTHVPLVFGLLSNAPPTTGQPKSYGTAEGGEAIQVVGANFTAPGSGFTTLLFDQALVPTAIVTSNTTIAALTPVGKDFTGTPVGPVNVSVVNGNGGVELINAFVYTPALVEVVPPIIGGTFEFVIAAPEAAQTYLLLGLPSLAFNKVPPLKGALLLQLTLAPIGPFPLPAGQTPLGVAVPLLPSLVGASVAIQSVQIPISGSNPGSFSSEIEVTVQ